MRTRKRKKILGSRARPELKADNFNAICEPIVYTFCRILNILQPYRPPRSVTGIAFTSYSALSPCLIKQQAMKTRRFGRISSRFLTSTLHGGEWLASMLTNPLSQPEKRLRRVEFNWIPEGTWKLWRKERSLALVGNPNQTRRSFSLHIELFQN
jgi:hypothetical protein